MRKSRASSPRNCFIQHSRLTENAVDEDDLRVRPDCPMPPARSRRHRAPPRWFCVGPAGSHPSFPTILAVEDEPSAISGRCHLGQGKNRFSIDDCFSGLPVCAAMESIAFGFDVQGGGGPRSLTSAVLERLRADILSPSSFPARSSTLRALRSSFRSASPRCAKRCRGWSPMDWCRPPTSAASGSARCRRPTSRM